jgi:hypothetical protein
MIVSPSRLPELALKPGILNALNARTAMCEVSATASHCIEPAIAHERSRSIHAAG